MPLRSVPVHTIAVRAGPCHCGPWACLAGKIVYAHVLRKGTCPAPRQGLPQRGMAGANCLPDAGRRPDRNPAPAIDSGRSGRFLAGKLGLGEVQPGAGFFRFRVQPHGLLECAGRVVPAFQAGFHHTQVQPALTVTVAPLQ